MEVKDWEYDEFPGFSEDVPGAVSVPTTGGEPGVRYSADVPYAAADEEVLDLQILVPTSRDRRLGRDAGAFPCVVYVQGSAWRRQNMYQDVPQLSRWAARGYVVALARYRHSGVAHFPAQCEDALEAVRFMRAHAAEYGVDPERMILAGGSSGGHTAVLAAIMEAEARGAGEPRPGTRESRYPDVSARVAGVIDLYGAVSLMRQDGFPTTVNHHQADSPEGMLMGCDLRGREDLCRRASAECRIVPGLDMPPVLIAHGTKDRTVSAQLSVDLYRRLRECGDDAELYLLEGADHGGPEFFMDAMLERYDAFCRRCFSRKA